MCDDACCDFFWPIDTKADIAHRLANRIGRCVMMHVVTHRLVNRLANRIGRCAMILGIHPFHCGLVPLSVPFKLRVLCVQLRRQFLERVRRPFRLGVVCIHALRQCGLVLLN